MGTKWANVTVISYFFRNRLYYTDGKDLTVSARWVQGIQSGAMSQFFLNISEIEVSPQLDMT